VLQIAKGNGKKRKERHYMAGTGVYANFRELKWFLEATDYLDTLTNEAHRIEVKDWIYMICQKLARQHGLPELEGSAKYGLTNHGEFMIAA